MMADEHTPAKKLKIEYSSLPECPYGLSCYRKNPKHFEEFFHPKSANDSQVVLSDKKLESTHVKQSSLPDSSLPPCKYGTSCYRKNLLHFAEYSHPTSGPIQDTNSSDTDVLSSDQDQKEKNEAKNRLCKGMSLVKKFSQMTEIERKELIQRAIEEKLRLEQELESTKKIVAEKDKELDQLQKQLNNGLLMLDGEQEALTKDVSTYFSLYPERAYKEGSANQIHFRLAESQFYRLLTGDISASIRVLKVDYVVSPKVVKRFRCLSKDLI